MPTKTPNNGYPNSLQSLPGVGPRIGQLLKQLGYNHPRELIGANPEDMYERIQRRQKKPIDRCVLYVFRCAVYAAKNPSANKEDLKWWNWKEKK